MISLLKLPPVNVLFSGHDFKFLTPIFSELKRNAVRFDIEQWSSHSQVKAYLSGKYKVRFCEWCLGNAEYHSNIRMPGSKLFIRFHRQELDTEFPARINWKRVTKIFFVSPHIARIAQQNLIFQKTVLKFGQSL